MDFDDLDTMGPPDLVAAMRAAYVRDRRPMLAHLDITYRCDLDCKHCYLDNKTTWPELNPAEFHNLIEQLHEAGVLNLVWSGGEVFQRQDFMEHLKFAASLGFISRVKTHAGHITAELAAQLTQCRVSRVDVSVYSLDPAIHDEFTQRSGSLAATLRGIDLLQAAGLVVKISSSVQPKTIEEIPHLWAYFVDRGCEINFNTNVFRDHSGSTALDLLSLTPTELQRAVLLIQQVTDPNFVPRPRITGQGGKGPCGAGRLSLYISPDGSLWPCVAWPMALGQVREKTVLQIWRESELRQQIVEFTNESRTSCQSCAGSGHCFYCSGEAFKLSGDFRIAPATFHAQTRANMLAWESAGGAAFGEDAWQSVPAAGQRGGVPKFKFPIYRAQKSDGNRVKGAKSPVE